MPVVRLGNRAAVYKDDVIEGDFVSEITVHDADPHHDQVRNITHVDGLWSKLSSEPATWVSCAELPRLEQALAAHFDCPVVEHSEALDRRELALTAPAAAPPTGVVENLPEISGSVDHRDDVEGSDAK
jgi:hypothetical protein